MKSVLIPRSALLQKNKEIVASTSNVLLTKIVDNLTLKTPVPSTSVGASPSKLPNEFVSTNLLDDPGILTKGGDEVKSNDSKRTSKTDADSDIEIIDESDPSSSNAASNESEIRISHVESLSVAQPSTEVSATGSNTSAEATSTDEAVASKGKNLNTTAADLYKCGFVGCSFGTSNSENLKLHMENCPENRHGIKCAYCEKPLHRINALLEHYKSSCLRRYICGMCNMGYPQQFQCVAHVKKMHKASNYRLVPANTTSAPTPGTSEDGLLIVHPLVSSCFFSFSIFIFQFESNNWRRKECILISISSIIVLVE